MTLILNMIIKDLLSQIIFSLLNQQDLYIKCDLSDVCSLT